jgi:hypothetical protein
MERTMSALHDLLTEVYPTGHLLTAAQIGTVFRHGSRSERDGGVNGIQATAKRIAAIQRGDTDSQDADADIAELVEDTVQRFSHLTGDTGDMPASSRDLAAQIAARRDEGSVGRERRADRAAAARKAREPLGELLVAASSGRAVRESDLDELTLRDGLGDAERVRFRNDVLAAGRKIATLRQVGNFASADRLAEETTVRKHSALMISA